MALIHIDGVCTSQGESLKLTEEQTKNCKVLYKKTDDNKYKFAGFYNPEIADENYEEGLIAVPLRSCSGGTVLLKKGTSVWNVVGSTGDYWKGKKCRDWIKVWMENCNGGKAPAEKCYVKGSGGSSCNDNTVGGHVITTNVQPQYGDNEKVYIIPICKTHNYYRNTNVMTVSKDVQALILDNYHNK